jgi:hypothetical protein
MSFFFNKQTLPKDLEPKFSVPNPILDRNKSQKKNNSKTKNNKNTRIDKTKITFVKGTYPHKYTAIVQFKDGRTKRVSFGNQNYQQFRDSTPLQLYKNLNHFDVNRLKNYSARHSKVVDKDGKPAYKKKYSRAWFSYYYLW